MATESRGTGRYVRPPRDNAQLIADLIVIINAAINMRKACRRAGVALDVYEVAFHSKVEERRVKGTRVSDVVHGYVVVGHTDNKHSAYQPEAPCWEVSIYTRADAPVNTLALNDKGADNERQLEHHPELPEALGAQVVYSASANSVFLLVPDDGE